MNGRDVAIVIGANVLVTLLVGLLGGGMMAGWGMMGWGGYEGNPVGWITMLLVWALIIGGTAFILVWLFRGTVATFGGPDSSRALEILKERYARGEITQAQYEEIRHELERR
jgi:putative membrane protein